MAAKKRNRQQARAQQVARARRAAEVARRRQDRKGRLTIGAFVAMIAVVGVLGLLLVRGGGGSDPAPAGSTVTSGATDATDATPPALASAAGKPCVPVTDALPAGAPSVPVRVGPPPTALVTQDLKEGTGAVVAADQTLSVNYIGVSCSTGKIFDSSYSRKEPVSFPLSGVIPGWQQGIPGMKVGGQRLLGIPAALGYGDQGGGGDIAPGETLWFVVEVLDAKVG